MASGVGARHKSLSIFLGTANLLLRSFGYKVDIELTREACVRLRPVDSDYEIEFPEVDLGDLRHGDNTHLHCFIIKDVGKPEQRTIEAYAHSNYGSSQFEDTFVTVDGFDPPLPDTKDIQKQYLILSDFARDFVSQIMEALNSYLKS